MTTHVQCMRMQRPLLLLLCLAVAAGCAGSTGHHEMAVVPEIRPGILAGYLPPETLPSSLALVPPPPAAGSAAFALDEEVSRQTLALRGTARWELAARDANLMFPEAASTFSCALGISITEQGAPHLYMLLRRTLADAGLATDRAKKHYQRATAGQRPMHWPTSLSPSMQHQTEQPAPTTTLVPGRKKASRSE